MNDDRHPELPRQFRGEAKVDRPVLQLGPLPPWHATVRVEPVQLRRTVSFRVVAEWTGPPALYMPPDPNPGNRQDVYATGDLQLAKAVAHQAAAQLGQGQVPDMREAAEQLRNRLAAGPYG